MFDSRSHIGMVFQESALFDSLPFATTLPIACWKNTMTTQESIAA